MNPKDGYVLLVEDNPDDEALTLRAFKKNNVLNEVRVVRDGQEALDFLFGSGTSPGHAESDRPALILLDLKLPRVDGLEVLRRIRADKRMKFVPVVVLTSSKQESDRMRGYELGCNSYVQKPVDFVQFADAAKILGMYWLLLNEPLPVTAGE
jgi:CheY-like chemotaxis protein